MDISRKTDYALRMIGELVRNPGSVLSVRVAAEKNNVPYSFARSIQHDLARVGIIESIRGSRGGMILACDPKKITLLDVVEAVSGPICMEICETGGPDGGPCPFMENCGYSHIWRSADNLLSAYFDSVTLEEVVLRTANPKLPSCYADGSSFSVLSTTPYEELKKK